MTIGDNEINYLCTSHVLHVLQSEENLREYSAFRAEQNHSDLLPAIYEGGLKIWECTYDLLKYINEAKLDFKNKRNSDVIKYVTIPNVLLNKKELNRCKFYSGDWQSLSDLLKTEITNEEKYDFIFTSETIYNTENYIKLHQVFETLLKKNGAIFLAAKSFYFGVGGGITLFEDFLEQQKIFKYSSCWKCEEGVKREILKIEFNS
ncbi:hypothetical protein NQ318_021044 [Aromia moschata]|uniref:Histidine protein methyltransferase 1 homolog n=1 Tax=Aromia moschata TaxID=1265417 RepID=A0AAV8Y8Z3_9CUCU|nr:hypothetical protein NQ318_021044 [Aromia moschata]